MFFTCFACGETLKKSAVDRHSQSCKSCWIIVCVDCNTRFEGGEYAKHTTCISEAEKHEKSVFKGGKGGGGKRDPQAEWCDTIARAAAAAPGAHTVLLRTLTGYGNCPRKLRPFVSFCKNSLKVHNEKLLGDLFAHLQTFLPPRAPKKAGGKEGVEEEGEEEGEEAGEGEAAAAEEDKEEETKAGVPEVEEGEEGEDAAAAAAAKAERKRAKRARVAEEAAAASAAASTTAMEEPAEEPAVVAKAAEAKPAGKAAAGKAVSKKSAKKARQAAAAAAAAAAGEGEEGEGQEPPAGGFNPKAFIYTMLEKAKKQCFKPRKLAQAASKGGGSSTAVAAKIAALLGKGKLISCDFRGNAIPPNKKKGKYIKRAPKEARAAKEEAAAPAAPAEEE